MRVLLLGVLMTTLLLAGAAKADVAQITLGTTQYTGGDITFTNTGTATQISFNGTLTGNGYVEPAGTQGTFTMSLSGTPTLGSPASNVYPVSMNGSTIQFQYYIGSSPQTATSELTGTINLTTVTDGSPTPRVNALLTVSGSTGIFASEWAVGNIANMDFTINLCPVGDTCTQVPPSGNYTSVDSVYQTAGTSTSGFLSSGEVLPAPVPEPASFALLGSGLLLTGSLAKARRRK